MLKIASFDSLPKDEGVNNAGNVFHAIDFKGNHYLSWCMSGSLTRGDRENIPDITRACAIHNFTDLAKAHTMAKLLLLLRVFTDTQLW